MQHGLSVFGSQSLEILLKIWKSAVAKLQGFDKHVEGFMCIRVYNNIYIYIYFESVLIAVTVNEKDLYFGRTLF